MEGQPAGIIWGLTAREILAKSCEENWNESRYGNLIKTAQILVDENYGGWTTNMQVPGSALISWRGDDKLWTVDPYTGDIKEQGTENA